MDLEQPQFDAVSRLFSSSVVREMARNGESSLFARLVRQSGLLGLSKSDAVHRLFDAAFALLQREGFRHEYVYKAALTHRVLLGKHSLQTAAMLNEFRVGECKADLVILNGTSTVYEVKSERDSLSRLNRQVAAYAQAFAMVNVIASEAHIAAVLDIVPGFVGVSRLTSRYRISPVREAVDGTDRVSPAVIFDSIRTREAALILDSLGVRIPEVPNTKLHAALREQFLKLRPREAHDGMVQVLKKTRNLSPLSGLVQRVPFSLRAAALSVPLRKADHARLVRAVNTPLGHALGWT